MGGRVLKIVFFDCDGVINSYDWDITAKPDDIPDLDIDPQAMGRLNYIYEETNALFVMSSDWREDFDDACKRLRRSGAEFPIIGYIPLHIFDMTQPDKSRGAEIEHWIADNVTDDDFNYVIIDDRADFRKKQKKHFVKINPKTGITNVDVAKVIKILKKKSK